MTQRNIELLQRTMQYIKDHPNQHDQYDYWTTCGTPSCFAGWALHLNGITRQQVCDHPYFMTGEYAASVLGLTCDEKLWLFSPVNTIPMLELMVKDLVNGDEMRDWAQYREEANEH